LAAGSVVHATHRRDLEALGGLLRRLPSTGLAFLAGSLAASALPPLCGFVSEWMIALAAFDGMVTRGPGMAASIVVITLLALVGGLAAACFVRAFGVAFLGEPRSTGAELEPREERLMVVSMSIAAFACLVLGVFPPALLSLVAPAVAVLVPVRAPILVGAALQAVSVVAALGIALLALVVWLRSRILAGREIRTALTWDCGYAAPSPRMQYTASSFAEPVIAPFTVALRPRISGSRPAGIFPASASYEASVDDLAARVAVSAVSGAGALLSRVTLLQLGRIQVYLLYIFVTVIALLVWSVPW
jgi:NADH:ubiquinone oxidoreductase subunit 5 (subunit L)/multisubunit Na+/H+ antiporter MnhA subunit